MGRYRRLLLNQSVVHTANCDSCVPGCCNSPRQSSAPSPMPCKSYVLFKNTLEGSWETDFSETYSTYSGRSWNIFVLILPYIMLLLCYTGTCSWLGRVCLQFLFSQNFIHQRYKAMLNGTTIFKPIIQETEVHAKEGKKIPKERLIFHLKITNLSFPTKSHYSLFMSHANVYQWRLYEWFRLYLLSNPFQNSLSIFGWLSVRI